ncbi:MAG: DegV family protein [Angustibacter sp.]
MPFAVVTDSTASLAADEVARSGVLVVPLQVLIGDQPYAEGVDLAPAEVAEALRTGRRVLTSRPTPQAFLDAYATAAERGANAVVSVHLAAAMSGTIESAVLAARQAPIPVEVVDSASVGLGLGFLVRDAVRAAHRGQDAAVAARGLRIRAGGSVGFFAVTSLDHLRRGGRIGGSAAALRSTVPPTAVSSTAVSSTAVCSAALPSAAVPAVALPSTAVPAAAVTSSVLTSAAVLVLRHGAIEPVERVRTAGRAAARLVELVDHAAIRADRVVPSSDRGGSSVAEVAVHHLDTPERAQALARSIEGRLNRRVPVATVGAVAGAHAGPGLLAVVVVPPGGGLEGS